MQGIYSEREIITYDYHIFYRPSLSGIFIGPLDGVNRGNAHLLDCFSRPLTIILDWMGAKVKSWHPLLVHLFICNRYFVGSETAIQVGERRSRKLGCLPVTEKNKSFVVKRINAIF